MKRKRVMTQEKQTMLIGLRVSETFYRKLEKWMEQSNCQTVTELVRAILYKEKINWYHKDASLESVALELAGIRKELTAMGRNINQITHHFHLAETINQKMVHALKVSEEYKKVGYKVEELLIKVEEIYSKWLQR